MGKVSLVLGMVARYSKDMSTQSATSPAARIARLVAAKFAERAVMENVRYTDPLCADMQALVRRNHWAAVQEVRTASLRAYNPSIRMQYVAALRDFS